MSQIVSKIYWWPSNLTPKHSTFSKCFYFPSNKYMYHKISWNLYSYELSAQFTKITETFKQDE